MKQQTTHSEDSYARQGLGLFIIQAEHLDKVRVEADFVKTFKAGETLELDTPGFDLPDSLKHLFLEKDTMIVAHHNAYVNTGLQNALNREGGLGGTAIGFIGVDNNATAVTAATTFLHGAAGATAANQIIKATTNSLSAQTLTCAVTSHFVNGDFTSGVFVINKIGLLTTSTDAGTGLVDVIGGTGGSSPYNRTFVLDLTSAGTFDLGLNIAVTATAV